MIYRGICRAFIQRGTQDVLRATAFLADMPRPNVLMSRADAFQISWKLLFKFVDDIGKRNAQLSGNLGTDQNSRSAVVAFSRTDRGLVDTLKRNYNYQ